ncbi:MAG: glycosyltransferase family 39 protein [Anaerolineae bacterium]|nr:glycosyltransferase family 39 protein [Anaerolineae bacterium]
MIEKQKDTFTFWGRFDLPTWLFFGALIIYLVTRLIGLDHFPIYFFTDEANQTQSIASLVENNYRLDNVLLPTYFPNGLYHNLGLSVYMQWLPYILFGKSAVLTRITSILITLLAAISIGFILRDIFKLKYWWTGTLFLSITPAWFLHSRTAFEVAEFVAFYSGALCAYLFYRHRSPRFLYLAIFLAACAFYTYSPAQVIVPLTTIALALSDRNYHFENRNTVLRGMVILILLGIPYLRFIFYNPHIPFMHLSTLGSYWMANTSFLEKLSRYVSEYAIGLSPWYWYTPNIRDLSRHLMKDYGHIMLGTLPFAVIGLFSVVRNLRLSANRLVVITMLVSPSAAALAGTSITRALVFVMPASILTALGLEIFLNWISNLQKKRDLSFSSSRQVAIQLFVFMLLSGVNIWMLTDSLRNGPTWYTDYGLGGMQYGGFQIFDIVKEYSQENPNSKIFVSPDWANGTNVLVDFFLDTSSPVWLWSIRGHINEKLPLDDSMVFVITPDDYKQVFENPKFSNLTVEKVVPYPDGTPGFYFIRLQYSEDIEALLAADAATRRVLQESYLTLAGDQVKLRYSKLDGEIQDIFIANLFDGDPLTFAKTAEANPFVVEITYPSPHVINGFSIITGSANVSILLTGYADEGADPVTYTFRGQGSIRNPELIFDLPAPLTSQTLHIEVLDINNKEPTFVHIWEITFR